jgi:hypothetical protein
MEMSHIKVGEETGHPIDIYDKDSARPARD